MPVLPHVQRYQHCGNATAASQACSDWTLSYRKYRPPQPCASQHAGTRAGNAVGTSACIMYLSASRSESSGPESRCYRDTSLQSQLFFASVSTSARSRPDSGADAVGGGEGGRPCARRCELGPGRSLTKGASMKMIWSGRLDSTRCCTGWLNMMSAAITAVSTSWHPTIENTCGNGQPGDSIGALIVPARSPVGHKGSPDLRAKAA